MNQESGPNKNTFLRIFSKWKVVGFGGSDVIRTFIFGGVVSIEPRGSKFTNGVRRRKKRRRRRRTFLDFSFCWEKQLVAEGAFKRGCLGESAVTGLVWRDSGIGKGLKQRERREVEENDG